MLLGVKSLSACRDLCLCTYAMLRQTQTVSQCDHNIWPELIPCRGSRIRKAVTNIFFDAIKRAVLSPSYMKEAWQKELETIAEDGLTPDEMLVMGLEDGSEKMPFFSGCSVYPIFPGAASK